MWKFLKEYIKHPITVGAIAPSGKNLTEGMMKPINFDKASVIVEYGPGTGSFTRALIKRKNDDCKLILIEQNDSFYKSLKEQYSNRKDIIVIHGRECKTILKETRDFISRLYCIRFTIYVSSKRCI